MDEIIHKIRADNQFKIERKAKNDLVTSADLASEAFIVNRLSELFPDDVIWAEENHAHPDELDQRIWIIDPIDGTTNFSHNLHLIVFPSLLGSNGIGTWVLVYELAHKQCFYATKGQGLFGWHCTFCQFLYTARRLSHSYRLSLYGILTGSFIFDFA